MALEPIENLTGMDRRELCQFASELCAEVEAQVGQMAFRGGIYEGNVAVDDNGKVILGQAYSDEPSAMELLYAAPELYWHGRKSPAGDVYSIGLLMYKLSEGRLPFESDDCDEKKAHRLRLQGSEFNKPANAGRRLGDIIQKALSYDPADRYRNPGEMKIMLDNCLKNLFLNDEPCAEAVFKKSDDDLSDIERMMVNIIETQNDFEENDDAAEVDESTAVVGPIFGESEFPDTDADDDAVTAPEDGDVVDEPRSDAVLQGQEEEEVFIGEEVPDNFDYSDSDDEYIPEGAVQEGDSYQDTSDISDMVPQLAEVEVEPEYEPVNVNRNSDDFPDIIVTNTGETVSLSQKEIEAEVRRRKRRPLIFIIILSVLLLIAALLFNKIMGPAKVIPESEPVEESPVPVVVVTTPVETPEPTPELPVEMISEYRFFAENVSWTEAKARCAEEGGHLVVINDADVFQKVIDLASEMGISVVWIGLHRESDLLVWETDDINAEFYYNWDRGEPSEYDGDIPEDYVFMWNWTGRGWVYNDCINDPEGEYPANYRNQIGFVCEIEKPKE